MNDTDARAAVIRRAEDACRPCGPCDGGLPMGCTCDPEPRAVIADLLNLIDTDAALVATRVAAARADALAPVHALADEWESLASRNARAFDYGRWHPAAAKQLRAALRAAVAVPEPEEGP